MDLGLGHGDIVLAVRNVSKGEKTKEALLTDPAILKSNTRADIRVMQFDAESYESRSNKSSSRCTS